MRRTLALLRRLALASGLVLAVLVVNFVLIHAAPGDPALVIAGDMGGADEAPSLIESAKLNRHDPWADLRDVFERLPTLKQRDLAQLLPHNWRPPGSADPVDSALLAAAA